jgi:hypothetical protein
MTDEPLDAGSETGLLEGSALDDDLSEELAIEQLLAEEGAACSAPPPELVALSFLAGNFFTAFVQTLGQRAADGSVKLPRRVAEVFKRPVWKRGRADEFRIGVRDGSAATIAITADTPDEARLALLDLDVTADELRGKLLRWDSDSSAWRPADDR